MNNKIYKKKLIMIYLQFFFLQLPIHNHFFHTKKTFINCPIPTNLNSYLKFTSFEMQIEFNL